MGNFSGNSFRNCLGNLFRILVGNRFWISSTFWIFFGSFFANHFCFFFSRDLFLIISTILWYYFYFSSKSAGNSLGISSVFPSTFLSEFSSVNILRVSLAISFRVPSKIWFFRQCLWKLFRQIFCECLLWFPWELFLHFFSKFL